MTAPLTDLELLKIISDNLDDIRHTMVMTDRLITEFARRIRVKEAVNEALDFQQEIRNLES